MANILFEYIATEALDNIVAFLYGEFDEVVYFFLPSEPENPTRDEALERFVTERLGMGMRFFRIPENTADAVLWSFHRVMSEYRSEDHFTVETTGGAELFLVAGGMLLSEERERVSFCNYAFATGNPSEPRYLLSMDEIIELQGCQTVNVCDGVPIDYTDGNFRTEILRLWTAVKDISADWNRFASLTALDEPDEPFTHGKTFSGEQDRISCKRIMDKLVKNQIVLDYQLDKSGVNRYILQYAYTDSVRTELLYEKSGTVLEMFACLAAAECGLFRDCRSSVSVDADGVITGDRNETRNEIDVTMMFGQRPVFVSCKNTRATKEFIYEIMVMARHYGGRYAIPVLISTAESFPAVAERASEMGVVLIEQVAGQTLRELKETFVRVFSELAG